MSAPGIGSDDRLNRRYASTTVANARSVIIVSEAASTRAAVIAAGTAPSHDAAAMRMPASTRTSSARRRNSRTASVGSFTTRVASAKSRGLLCSAQVLPSGDNRAGPPCCDDWIATHSPATLGAFCRMASKTNGASAPSYRAPGSDSRGGSLGTEPARTTTSCSRFSNFSSRAAFSTSCSHRRLRWYSSKGTSGRTKASAPPTMVTAVAIATATTARRRTRATDAEAVNAGTATMAATAPAASQASTTGSIGTNDARCAPNHIGHWRKPRRRTVIRSYHCSLVHCMAKPKATNSAGTPITAASTPARRSPKNAGSARHHGMPEAHSSNAHSWLGGCMNIQSPPVPSPRVDAPSSASEIPQNSASTALHTRTFEAANAPRPTGSAAIGRPAARPSQ